ELENTVTLVARHFDQLFEDTETVAADVLSQLRVSEIASAETFREKLSTPEAHELLKSRVTIRMATWSTHHVPGRCPGSTSPNDPISSASSSTRNPGPS